MIFDSCFIIEAEREARKNKPGKAHRFLENHRRETVFITFTIAGELACGESVAARKNWERLLAPYPLLPWAKEISWRYGELFRTLKREGNLIGTNDLWIAATAIHYGKSLVSDNHKDFSRIPGLNLIPF